MSIINKDRIQYQGQYPGNNNFQRGNDANYGQNDQGWRQDAGPSNRQQSYNNFQQYPSQQDRTQKLEGTFNQFIQMSMANQKNADTSIKNLETQVGQMTTTSQPTRRSIHRQHTNHSEGALQNRDN